MPSSPSNPCRRPVFASFGPVLVLVVPVLVLVGLVLVLVAAVVRCSCFRVVTVVKISCVPRYRQKVTCSCQQRREFAFMCIILINLLDFGENKCRAECSGNNRIYLRFLAKQDGTVRCLGCG